MSRRKFRVFEVFAGIGAQHAVLKRLGLNYEIVGISVIRVNLSVLEFIGLNAKAGLVEDYLQKGILARVKDFVLELGNGFLRHRSEITTRRLRTQ